MLLGREGGAREMAQRPLDQNCTSFKRRDVAQQVYVDSGGDCFWRFSYKTPPSEKSCCTTGIGNWTLGDFEKELRALPKGRGCTSRADILSMTWFPLIAGTERL